ncbi:class I SAM-dependent methyltransferase [Streptococcus himalayensis]|uniref:Methylase n=1 Tax=Streptococcus himalayensis TaxID=1888195 RepID=A0A917EGX9_9STRE|nr:class I SAM-dependent methyltransferase [Streptococcus himalayensis]GGE34802.1 methylase [Streptococcus himalayensis]
MAEAGHTLLARLGKKRLRPGGKIATNWLLKKGNISKDCQILEVACNMGTTSIELAKTYGCQIQAVDLDKKALEQAGVNAKAAGVSDLVMFKQANAMKLPFPDESFDVVINEAMLTMQSEKGKQKCLQEYYRVLKPNGLLLTHDVMLRENDEEVRARLSKAIHVNVAPLTKENWKSLVKEQGFSAIESLSGEMTLMSPKGMIYDEGLFGTLKIFKNALKAKNRSHFFTMFQTFREQKDRLGFIAMAAKK